MEQQPIEYTTNYLLDHRVTILQPCRGYRASTDAVFLAAFARSVRGTDRILDVGAGTGAVSLCLARHFPNNEIVGVEIQPALAALSTQSAALNGFQNVHFICGALERVGSSVSGNAFDHVFTNPPYYENQSVSPEPSKALAHGNARFDLQNWLVWCFKKLKPYGYFYMIYPPEGLNRILSLLDSVAGNVRLLPFYTLPNAPAKRVLIAAQKTSKAPTVILPPFYAHTLTGEHTAECAQILRGGKLFSDLGF
jgi:tRNA1(Val) A37 N6-methylase TrmN6